MIPLTERKPAMLLEDLYPLRSAAGFESRLPEWLSNRVLTDLVIVGYGGVLALLGTLVNPFLVELGIGGALPRAFDPMIGGFVAAVFVLICIPIVSMDLRGLQRFRQSSRQMIVSFAAALFSLLVFVWSTPLAWSANASVVLWFLLGCSVLAVLHGVVSRYLREAPAISELAARHLAIVCGHERTCAQFLDLLRAQHDAEIRLIGVFHDTAERRGPAGAKLGRTIDDLLDYARERRIDEIFIALPWHAERRISALVERLGHLPVDL